MRWRWIMSVVVLLAGCASRTGDPAARPEAPTTSYLVKETTLVNGAVAVHLDIPFQPTGPKPAVIALLGDSHPIVAEGWVAVTYSVRWGLLRPPQPTPAPDQTVAGKWVLASPSADIIGQQYLRDIAATADTYLPAVIDWLVAQPEIDPTRLAIAGTSTNGFIALRAAAVDRRLGVVVAIAACGDYERFLQFSEMGMAGKPLALSPAYAQWLHSQEVISDPTQLTHAAVLMINRSPDPLIPVSCADETARVLTDAFTRAGVPQRFRYLRFDTEGHGVGGPELAETMAWLKQWLASPPSTG